MKTYLQHIKEIIGKGLTKEEYISIGESNDDTLIPIILKKAQKEEAKTNENGG